MSGSIDLGTHWFQPDPDTKQLAFLSDWTAESVYAGGVGAGKTLTGSVKALIASLKHPGTVGLVGRQSYRALEDTTKKVMLDGDDKPPVIPKEMVRRRHEGDNRIELINGSEILFRSFQDFNIEKLLSLNLGWFYLDEATETTDRIWLTLLGRLRHPAGPRCGWGTTNPNGHDWLWRRFHPDAGENMGHLYVSPTEANHRNLAPDYIARLRLMPKEWQRRFVDASFDTAAGQIWDEWDRHAHVVAPFEIPYQWNRVEALDHGRRNPTAYLQAATDYDGNLIIYDGYYQPGLPEQHAAAIRMLRGARKWPSIVADPSVYAKGATGRSVADLYAELGIQFRPGANDVTGGLLRVAQELARDPAEVFPEWHQWAGTLGPDGLGSPTLFVMDVPGTHDLRREIPDYRWRDLSPSQERDHDQPEEPRKKDDHAVDALRYLVMSRPAKTLAVTEPRDPDRAAERRTPTSGVRTMKF